MVAVVDVRVDVDIGGRLIELGEVQN